MRARDPIVFSEMGRNARGYGFFTDIKVREARQFSVSVHQLNGKFAPANQDQFAIEVEQNRSVEFLGSRRSEGGIWRGNCTHFRDLEIAS
jgi:hypothetical protein